MKNTAATSVNKRCCAIKSSAATATPNSKLRALRTRTGRQPASAAPTAVPLRELWMGKNRTPALDS